MTTRCIVKPRTLVLTAHISSALISSVPVDKKDDFNEAATMGTLAASSAEAAVRGGSASDENSTLRFECEGKIDKFCPLTRELAPLWDKKIQVQVQVKRNGNGILYIPHPSAGKELPLLNRPIRGEKFRVLLTQHRAYFYLSVDCINAFYRGDETEEARCLEVNRENGLKLQDVLEKLGAQPN